MEQDKLYKAAHGIYAYQGAILRTEIYRGVLCFVHFPGDGGAHLSADQLDAAYALLVAGRVEAVAHA